MDSPNETTDAQGLPPHIESAVAHAAAGDLERAALEASFWTRGELEQHARRLQSWFEGGPVGLARAIDRAKADQQRADYFESLIRRASEATTDSERDAIVERLADVNEVAYDGLRSRIAKGLRCQTKTLDKLVKAARERNSPKPPPAEPTDKKSGPKVGGGTRLELLDDEPHEDPQDGAKILDEVRTLILRHVVLPAAAAVAVALWIVWTHAVDLGRVAPILCIRSPRPRCGKTTTLAIVTRLAARALPASNISQAAVYRVIEASKPTLLIDEAETILDEAEELRGILNSGHTRDAAYVIRLVGDSLEPQTFSTWGAKCLALIGALPPTLHDRSVVIELRRRAAGENVTSLDELDAEACAVLRRRITRFLADHADEIRRSRPSMPPGLHDRARDNWRPLLAVADLAGGGWPKLAREAAVELTRAADADEEDLAVLLLSDLCDLFSERNAEKLTTDAILERLSAMGERPWPTFGRGDKPLNARQLGSRLRPFKIHSTTIRVGPLPKDVAKGYLAKDFADAWRRYLPEKEPLHRYSPHKTRRKSESERLQNAENVTEDTREKPAKDAACNGVTHENGGTGGLSDSTVDAEAEEAFDL